MTDTKPATEVRGPARRQWGADRRDKPISVFPPPISERRIAIGRLAIVATVIAWLGYFISWISSEFLDGGVLNTHQGVEAVGYLIVVTLLTASAIAYLICRLGYCLRSRDHRRVPRAALDEFFGQKMPTLTVIVPSYREESRVVRTTLLSAALQEYPYLRVVLLIDDPPNPGNRHDADLLEAARNLPREIEELLSEPAARFSAQLERFERRGNEPTTSEEMDLLAEAYTEAVDWLHKFAGSHEIIDNADAFFANHIVQRLAADLAVTAAAVRAAAADGTVLPDERILELYRRLTWTFRAELSSFERKQYASLSHEPNKAMNLNSYIALMGGSYRDVVTVSGRVLVQAPLGASDLDVPEPDYVLTLDADSVLLPEYCIRLVYLMEQSEHARVGVAQTPYSAYPGAESRLERIAGATTDLQHIVHQGMTHYDATFWVGANAVLRKKALDEVADTAYAGNWPVRRYIRDRTVIEDTESTIDLGTHGWTLLNYPERLSYSSTPPDFGALCIQRRRWANGGLIILPKLHRQSKARKARGERTRFAETFLRTNYMASICWASISLVFLLAYPFANRLANPWLGLIALPYFIAMASDLRHCGYKGVDVFRIYGFNLILLPVNLAGVGNSIVQSITGDKSVFGRTPKVQNRTIPNLMFVVAPYVLVGFAAFTIYNDLQTRRWDNFVYASLNSVLAAYAIVAYIGIGHSIHDAWVQVVARLYKPETPKGRVVRDPAAIVADPAVADWASVLYFGSTNASPLIGTLPMQAQRGTSLPVTLQHEVRDSLPSSLTGESVAIPSGAAGLDGTMAESRSGGAHSVRSAAQSISADISFRTVFQPIVALQGGRAVGYEALTRFDDGVGPAEWLAEATSRGAGVELETMLARAAILSSTRLPDDSWVGLNVSSDFARARSALRSIIDVTARTVVLEINRDAVVDPAIRQMLAELPEHAVLGITGASPNYDSLALVRDLRPGVVKLERAWVHQLNLDAARRALIRALVTVADEGTCMLIAEGVETSAELETLRDLGVGFGQGYLLGRPRELVASRAHVAGDTTYPHRDSPDELEVV